ncbi:MAG: glycerophosphodiester phosphodiesterase, partial [Acidimicrobiales bacterium]
DASLERLWEVSHDVGELDLAQIARIGSGDCRVPTLREVLDTIGVPLMVDFTGEEVVHGALEEVRRARAAERCMFVTGNVPALRMLRSLAPAVRIGLTWTKAEAPPRWLLDELRADFWNPWFPLLRVDDVAEMHAAGTQVSTWTVDEHEDMVRVLSAGVDAVVSNRIHELRSMLSGPEPRARTP